MSAATGGRAVTVNQSPLLGRPGAMWASLCVSSVCMHLSSVSVSLPPLRALSLGPGPAGLCLRVPLTVRLATVPSSSDTRVQEGRTFGANAERAHERR